MKLGQDNGYRLYVDIMTGESCRQFSLQIWTLSKSHLVHPVGDLGKGADLVILVNSF